MCEETIMSDGVLIREGGAAVAVGGPAGNWVRVLPAALAGIAIVSSAFHFWPFENSKAWQMLCPANSAVLLWVLVLGVYLLLKRRLGAGESLLPHVSVLAYVGVNVLAVAFAPDLNRAANFTVKLALMLIGGYVLFSSAIYSLKTLRLVYGLATVAVALSVSYCLVARLAFGADDFGFHGSAYKYGTYIAVLACLCGVYLFTSGNAWTRLLGGVLVVAAIISSGSVGAVVSIAAGIATSAIVLPRWSVRLGLVAVLLVGAGLLVLSGSGSFTTFLQDDFRLVEKDGVNLKQRYIEWQAEVNLLEERTVAGTGPGCINEYRSSFYYRLPKLNTLKPFDQNGWLATGAETGILGLLCFCWIVVHYMKQALAQVGMARRNQSHGPRRFAAANFAAMVAACVANLFSAVHYNGILIVFVLVLALVSKTNLLIGEESG
ncbi:MAG: O-antigen ligase family protein [Planctomycetota bacterium]|jgi:hypothetical protein